MIAGSPNAGADLRRDEDAVAGRRSATTRRARRAAPSSATFSVALQRDRQVLLVGRTGAAWSAPLRPVQRPTTADAVRARSRTNSRGCWASCRECRMRLQVRLTPRHYVPIAPLIRAGRAPALRRRRTDAGLHVPVHCSRASAARAARSSRGTRCLQAGRQLAGMRNRKRGQPAPAWLIRRLPA